MNDNQAIGGIVMELNNFIGYFRKRIDQLEVKIEGGGDRRLLALFVLQDNLGDLLPELNCCSGIDCAIRIMRKALGGES